MKIKYSYLSLLFLIGLFLFVPAITRAAGVADAVAVRVLPNQYWLSISKWYASQGYTGSPQKMIVDGYEAIRDNRTVYVAALNTDNQYGPQGIITNMTVYNNIYIITYNEGADTGTVDIFGKILSTWKFNTNIAGFGHCSIAPKGTIASNPLLSIGCVLDSECPSQFFCDSTRAKLIRDQNRIASFLEIRNALWSYKNTNQHYPILESGTYLKNAVISTWPSWSNVFLTQTGVNVNDPINRLGDCSSEFDATTCWDSKNYKYYNNTTATNLQLPPNSFAMAYSSNPTGASYNLCLNREKTFLAGSGPLKTVIDSIQNCDAGKVGSSAVNQPPKITSPTTFNVPANNKLTAYLKISDPESDTISFSFAPVTGYGFSVQSTNDPYQLKISSDFIYSSSGQNNVKIGTLTLTDVNGNNTNTDIFVNFASNLPAPAITAGDIDYYVSSKPENALDYTAYIGVDRTRATNVRLSTDNGAGGVTEIAFLELNSNKFKTVSDAKNIGKTYLHNTNVSITEIGVDNFSKLWQYHLKIQGNILVGIFADGTKVTEDIDKKYKIEILDGGTASSAVLASKEFIIHFKANAPKLSMECNKQAALFNTYKCQVLNANSNNLVAIYSVTSTPINILKVDSTTGLIQGLIKSLGKTTFTVTAANEYGATTTISSEVTGVKYGCGMIEWAGGPWDAAGNQRIQLGYYRTIKMADRCWFADNLNIREVGSKKIGNCYKDLQIHCDAGGAFYNGGDVSDNLCPTGWHIPNDAEFAALSSVVDNDGRILSTNGVSGFDVPYYGRTTDYQNRGSEKDAKGFYWEYNNIYISPSMVFGNTAAVGHKRNFISFTSAAPANIATSSSYYDNYDSGYNAVNAHDYYSLRCVQDLPCANACASGEYCEKYTGNCKSLCGNGIVDSGEICDEGLLSNGGFNGINIYSSWGFCNDTCSGLTKRCGDGVTQFNELEKCDGTDNVATTPATSSSTKQYACTDKCAVTGGYCGDAIIQTAKGEACENINNRTPACKKCNWEPVYMAGQISTVGNGVETKLSGIKITLTKSDGTVYSATTDANGRYSIGTAANPTITSGASLTMRINVDASGNLINTGYEGVTQSDMVLYDDNPTGNFVVMSTVDAGKYIYIATWTNPVDLDSHLVLSRDCSERYYINKGISCTINGQDATLDFDSVSRPLNYEVISFKAVAGTTYTYTLLGFAGALFGASTHISLYKPVGNTHQIISEWRYGVCSKNKLDGSVDYCNNASDCEQAAAGAVCNNPSDLKTVTLPPLSF